MKKFLTSALLLVGISAFSQTATTSTTSTSTSQTTALSAKAKAVCKTWSLTQTEMFSDVHQPTEQQKGDQIIFMENGRYRLIYNGVGEGGVWTMDKGGVWINLASDAGVVKKFKVLENSATTLKVDYQDADLVHNILYYSNGAVLAPAGK